MLENISTVIVTTKLMFDYICINSDVQDLTVFMAI